VPLTFTTSPSRPTCRSNTTSSTKCIPNETHNSWCRHDCAAMAAEPAPPPPPPPPTPFVTNSLWVLLSAATCRLPHRLCCCCSCCLLPRRLQAARPAIPVSGSPQPARLRTRTRQSVEAAIGFRVGGKTPIAAPLLNCDMRCPTQAPLASAWSRYHEKYILSSIIKCKCIETARFFHDGSFHRGAARSGLSSASSAPRRPPHLQRRALVAAVGAAGRRLGHRLCTKGFRV